jgi:hypothetical protein
VAQGRGARQPPPAHQQRRRRLASHRLRSRSAAPMLWCQLDAPCAAVQPPDGLAPVATHWSTGWPASVVQRSVAQFPLPPLAKVHASPAFFPLHSAVSIRFVQPPGGSTSARAESRSEPRTTARPATKSTRDLNMPKTSLT